MKIDTTKIKNIVHTKGEKLKILAFSVVIMAVLIILDQLSKDIIIKYYAVGEGKPLIKDFLEILHIKNKGSAWGMFDNKPVVPVIVSCLLIILIFYVYSNLIRYRHFRKVRICVLFLLSGAISNIIDRIRIGSVTDFIYFKFIDFPVFNVADIYVTLSIGIMLIFMIVSYKGDDIDVMLGSTTIDSEGHYIDKSTGKSIKRSDTDRDKDSTSI